MKYRALEFPFTKQGWTHELVERKGLFCIVRRHKKGTPEHFEVIRIKERPSATFMRAGNEITVEAHEAYPSDEDWGTYGFSFTANSHCDPLAAARAKMVSWAFAGQISPISRGR